MSGFRLLKNYDDTTTIAKWIYSTDKFMFDKLFNNNEPVFAIEKMINSNYFNPYHRKFITLFYDDNPKDFRGMVVSYKSNDFTNKDVFKALYTTGYTNIYSIFVNWVLNYFLSSNIGENDYYVGNLYVDEKYRTNGVGSNLINKSKEIALKRNCDNILLDVEYDKSYLLNFYSKLGFKYVNKNYYTLFKNTYGCYGMKYNLKGD